ncbi:HotDog domain-containing protein [Penicillium atrosanguineum]|uniref:uncharacterized protein n=1 Tax=Penicillium atrosanguineum TaxID=1132637 RepID=UPI002397DCEC|nr:uncharacterized protein N7443_001739 [Penicillium atrosanguineum]KAJ5126455.1 HotDog domain-containing protein [Penicillium atrosanguineum]KAJ5146654.1 HotDog domain-containing protein [Penicillium atrosanguineum]KAJ5314855.1 hypothetical protein N7443_001739 [Penicillium atrosanguineum]
MATKQARSPVHYIPDDEISKEVEQQLQMHPFTQSIRSNISFTEKRFYESIPEATRTLMLTTGSLLGPGKIIVPPLSFRDKNGKTLFLVFYLGAAVCGYPGVVHGGLLATILDEGLASCSFLLFSDRITVTANLNVKFRKPAPTDKFYVLKADVLKVDGSKAWIEGKIGILGPNAGQIGSFDDGEVVAEAKGIYQAPITRGRLRAMI